eukprot:7927846-Pyramimonas_sp.AAC.2
MYPLLAARRRRRRRERRRQEAAEGCQRERQVAPVATRRRRSRCAPSPRLAVVGNIPPFDQRASGVMNIPPFGT